MGYCINQTGAKFSLKTQNREAARNAILAIDFGKSGQIGWVRSNEIKKTASLEDLFSVFRFEVDSPVEDGDITTIDFCGEKAGEDIDALFTAIAPFVESGSYIKFVGEDGECWRWYFDGKTAVEQAAKVTWD